MSDIALSLLSFLAGWLGFISIAGYFAPREPSGRSASNSRSSAPQSTPSEALAVIILELARLLASRDRSQPSNVAAAESSSAADGDGGGHDKIPYLFAGVVSIILAAILVEISVGESLNQPHAFNFEKMLVADKWPRVVAWSLLGCVAAYFRAGLSRAARSLLRATEDSRDEGKDRSTSWPFRLIALMLVLVVAVFVVNPHVLDRITSFKAGGVEADFGAAASSEKIRNAPVNMRDIAQKASLSGYEQFWLLDESKVEDNQDHPQYDLDWPSPKSSNYKSLNYRSLIYKSAGAPYWRVRVAQELFSGEFKKLFAIAQCYEQLDRSDVIRQSPEFSLYVSQIASLIRRSVTSSLTMEQQVDLFTDIYRKAHPEPSTAAANLPADQVSMGFEDEWIKLLDKVAPDFRPEGCSAKKLRMRRVDLDEVGRIALCRETEFSPFPRSGRMSLFAEKQLADCQARRSSRLSIWDPFVVAAVADMIAFTEGNRAKAGFLEIVSPSLLQRNEACLPGSCTIPVPGLTNLYYQIAQAKFSDQGTWPLADTIEGLAVAISYLDDILSAIEHVSDVTDAAREEMRLNYRRTRLDDLAQGLEIFNQHALSGETITPQLLAQWQAWLDDTQQILQPLEGIYAPSSGMLSSTEAEIWSRNKHTFEENWSDIIGDAEMAVALSLVLLPSQTDKPSALECLKARAVHNHLLHLEYHKITDDWAVDDRATYKGLLEQVGGRIAVACVCFGVQF